MLDGQENVQKSKPRQDIFSGPDDVNVGMLLSRPNNLAHPLPSYEQMAHIQAVSTSDVLSPNIGQLHEIYFKDRFQFISVLEQAICTTQSKKMSNKLKKFRNILQNKRSLSHCKTLFFLRLMHRLVNNQEIKHKTKTITLNNLESDTKVLPEIVIKFKNSTIHG